VGELELIAAIETALADRSGRLVRWTGDDAAVTRARPFAVTSIDTLVDGVHFRRATHGLRDIGWKALAAALSDLAAMGADAGEAYVSVVLPPDVDEPLELIHGMEELASETGMLWRARCWCSRRRSPGGPIPRRSSWAATAHVPGISWE
jgi:thiamine-monophosphate kinase